MIYIYLSLFTILAGKIKQLQNKRAYLSACFIQFFLVFVLRDATVGKDTNDYLNIFNALLANDDVRFELAHYEIGFRALNKFLVSIGCGERTLLFCIGLVICLGFAKFIYDNTDDIVSCSLGTFIFSCVVFPASLNTMRQYMAVAIAIHFVSELKNKKIIKAVIFILIGALFHKVVLLYLLLLIIYMIRKPKKIMYLAIPIAVITFVEFDLFVAIVGAFTSSFSYYLSSEYSVSRWFRMSSFIVVLEFILLWFSYFQSKKTKQESEIASYRIFLYVISVNLVFAILYLKNEVFSRILDSLDVFVVVSIPMALLNIKGISRYSQVIKTIVYLIVFVILVNSVFSSGHGIQEYRFYFM